MTNRNIDLPSQRAKLVMEIERPLRRKFRSERKYGWIALFLFMIALTILYFLVARIVDDQANAVQKAHAAEVGTLCSQYLNDTKLAGTAAEETLKTICHD